jgi:hypothetical protein
MVEASMTSERRGGHPQEAVVTPIGQCLARRRLQAAAAVFFYSYVTRPERDSPR